MSNMNWFYDEETGHYVVKGARILFPNFEGAEQDYNQAGKRNFRLVLDEDLTHELRDRGVYVREREGREDEDETQYLLKVGVYPDADIRFLNGKAMSKVAIVNNNPREDQASLIDEEFRKGHIKNGEISVEFHVSKNTRVVTSSPYVRVDTMIIPIRKSRLLEDYEMDDDADIFDD